jgi:hypothetical protein
MESTSFRLCRVQGRLLYEMVDGQWNVTNAMREHDPVFDADEWRILRPVEVSM